MSENQKLRDALSELIEAYNRAGPELSRAERAVDRMRLIAAHEALALPTADHIPDAGKMIETAAPVGERELPPLPSCARWEERIKTLMQQCGHPNSMSIYQAFKQFQNEFEHEMIAYARAALSAGDAVDAQRYRWLREQHWSNSAICCVYKPKQNVRLGGTCPSGDLLDSAIDAAMRKGQL